MKNFIKSIMTALAMVFAAGTALAGGLDAPAAPTDPGSAMYTGADIYNRLTTGAAGVKRSGPFADPTAGPAAGGHTLDEIMAIAPAADNTNGAAVTDVLSGKTFWGLRTDGTWGPKSGTVAAGSNVTGGNGSLSITIPDGLYSGGKSATAADANLITGNIKSGVSIFGVAGNTNVVDTTEATAPAAAANISNGKKAYVNGTLVTGTYAPALAKRVNKTGQTTSYGTRDDGALQYGIDPAVAPTGGTTGAYNTPALVSGTRFTDNGDGTVTDNLTALIWLKNANCFALQDWGSALYWANNLASGACGLSDGSTAGQWRLPNINELHSLGPTWPPGTPFTAVQGGYWSGSSLDTFGAWVVNMFSGNVSATSSMFNYNDVWPVRSGQ